MAKWAAAEHGSPAHRQRAAKTLCEPVGRIYTSRIPCYAYGSALEGR